MRPPSRRAENRPLLMPSRGTTTPLPPMYFPCTLGPRRALLPLCRPRQGRGPKQVRPSRGRPRARRAPPPPSGCPLLPRAARSLFPPGARARGGGPVPGGAQAGAALYLRVFVKQRQAFLGYFEALGQPFAQPFHGLVMGHRQVVAGPRGAVDRQAHGCGRLRGRAQLAGAAGGPAPAAPGAAGLRLHPRRAQENWGPAGRLQSLPGLPR